MALSLLGIIIGLVLMVILSYKGHSILWVAPLCALVVAIFALYAGLGEGRSLLTVYTEDYIGGLAEYLASWFPAFFLGAIYGKVMDLTGTARSLGNAVIRLIGPKYALLAVAIPCMLLTYGGISLFVVVFVMYPMGYAIYREANIPRTLLPGAIAYGAFGITMTCIPGTPQIQNLIPIEYYGTTAMAAPGMSITAAVIIGGSGYFYLNRQIRKAKEKRIGFTEDPKYHPEDPERELPKWHWLAGVIPIAAVFICLNVLDLGIVLSLLIAIALCCLMNIRQCRILPKAFSDGAVGSVGAIMNTSSAVGFGAVVKVVPGFTLLTKMLLNLPGSILVSEAVATNVLAGATGSASGGVSIALSALSEKYLEAAAGTNITPEMLHRVAALASGGLHMLPHNGALLTLLAVSHCTHKESYKDICITCCIIPAVTSAVLAAIWGLVA